VNLKRRLDRRVEQGVSALPGSVTLEAPERQRKLLDLRLQLHSMLERCPSERSAPPPRPALGRTASEILPFAARAGASGAFWQRVARLEPAHRVGRVRLDTIALADTNALAELALDPAVASSSLSSWLFLDLETTGFAGAGTLAFLVGMAAVDADGSIVVEQLLLREPSSEPALLERVAERIAAASLIISFNGKAFDRPLLDGRYVMNRLAPPPGRPHLDLLHVGRRLHGRRLQRCTLGRVERGVLGFDRGDDVSGSEMPAIYAHFLRSSDETSMAAVVRHNFSDVVSMVALVALYGQRSPALVGQDLASLARTLQRAGAMRYAESVADAACERGGGADALRVRAALCKSRGDALGAIRDLERLCREADDPVGRLELAKLYEHGARRPACALRWAEQGTSEDAAAHRRRLDRLERKIRRNPVA
jgi:uncharacterized protein